MIGFLIRYRYFVLSGTVAMALVVGWVVVRGRIYDQGFAACEAKYEAAKDEENSKIIKKKREVRHETQSLDRIDIIRQLCAAGWVRDKNQCPAD